MLMYINYHKHLFSSSQASCNMHIQIRQMATEQYKHVICLEPQTPKKQQYLSINIQSYGAWQCIHWQ